MAGSATRSRGRVRLALLLAGTLAVSFVLLRTSASWTDQTRLSAYGPTGGPVTSSSFGIEQRPVDPSGRAGAWGGGGSTDPVTVLPFGRSAELLAPGDHVYGGLEVRTRQGSLAGSLRVGPARLQAGAADLVALRGLLRLRIAAVPVTSGGTSTCSAMTFAEGAATTVFDGPLDRRSSSRAVPVAGAGGGAVLLCFEVAVAGDPATALEPGRRIDARWALTAVSDR